MATVFAEEEPMSEELRQDRARRALRVAVVAGFMGDSRSAQESCLGLCNACREGIPLKSLLIGENVPPTLLAMVLPNDSRAQQTEAPPTRVLQHRRVLQVEWNYTDVQDVAGVGGFDVSEVQWPEGTKEILLLQFKQTVEHVTWPVSLERLSFAILGPARMARNATRFDPWPMRSFFDHPLHNATFPSGLREIFLGETFSQPLDTVAWPHGLERMSLPGFDENNLDDVKWPPALKHLEFMPPKQIRLRKNPNTCAEELDFDMTGFNCPFFKLPMSLETLWLSDAFAQCLEIDPWPPGLVTMGLGKGFDSFFTNRISWPSSVRNIYTVHEINRPPQGCVVTTVKDYDTDSHSFEHEPEDGWVYGDMSDEISCDDVYEDDDCPFTGFAADTDHGDY